MFIPINIGQNEYKKNDIVVSIEKIENDYEFFTIGHEFIVIEKVPNYSLYKLIDSQNQIIINVDARFFTLKTEINEVRQIYIDIIEKDIAIKFIKDNCPHKGKYDTCKLKKYPYHYLPCECEISCVNHIDKKKINKVMMAYIRKLKIKKLKNI